MKRINFKLFFISAIIFIGIFSLFFISHTKIFAQLQVADDIVVETTGYSVLSPTSFVFGGYYSGNYDKKGFTTYFEFKKATPGGPVISVDLNNLLNSGQQTTQKIIRKNNVKEANDFYISPELNSSSTYYFRAVGYFNTDIEGKKFYGNVLTINTDFPISSVMPFSVGVNGDIIDYVAPVSSADIISGPGDKTICYPPDVLDEKTGLCENSDEICYKPEVFDETTGHCGPPIVPGSNDPNNPGNGGNNNNGGGGVGKYKFTGLVPVCNTIKDNKGGFADPCDFNMVMALTNKVINYALFVLFIPIAAILFAYAGVMMLTSGGEIGKKKKALSVFWNVGLGLVIAVASWLIISTLLSILGYSGHWIGF